MSPPRIVPTREGYDRWADTYDTMGNWLLALEEPEVDRAVGDVDGLAVLDVGAGTGRHAIRIASRGARVTALDFSEAMLAKAREKGGSERVRWVVHDLATRLPFADRSFDVVLSALVLEHVRVADLPRFFSELGRVARRGGRVVVTAMHPAMFLRGVSANFVDEGGTEIRPRSYEATLSDYVMGALHGLEIVTLSEHAVPDRVADRYERARKWLGWPALVVMACAPRRGAD